MKINKFSILSLIFLLTLTSKLQLSQNFGFKLSSKWDRCFYEELKKNTNTLLNYVIYGTEKIEQKDLKHAMQNIIIKVFYTIPDKNYRNLVANQTLTKPKGKIPIEINDTGLYKICVTYYGGYWEKRTLLTMGYKITSDSTKAPSLKNAVMGAHVREMHDSLRNAMSSVEGMISSQEFEISLEEEDEKRIESTAFFFSVFTVLQIIVILGLFVFQILNYKIIIKKEASD